jgi:tellurite resistance protein
MVSYSTMTQAPKLTPSEALVQSLVAVAWADGRMDRDEAHMLHALMSALGLDGPQAESLRDYARTPRSLDDAPIEALSAEEAGVLLQQAVVLTYVDGEQSVAEHSMIAALIQRLPLAPEVATAILSEAEARARRLAMLL